MFKTICVWANSRRVKLTTGDEGQNLHGAEIANIKTKTFGDSKVFISTVIFWANLIRYFSLHLQSISLKKKSLYMLLKSFVENVKQVSSYDS